MDMKKGALVSLTKGQIQCGNFLSEFLVWTNILYLLALSVFLIFMSFPPTLYDLIKMISFIALFSV